LSKDSLRRLEALGPGRRHHHEGGAHPSIRSDPAEKIIRIIMTGTTEEAIDVQDMALEKPRE